MGRIPVRPPCSKRTPSAAIHRHRGCPAQSAGSDCHHPGRAPDVVFAPHVETAAGTMLPDDYLRAVGDAVHAVGRLMVLPGLHCLPGAMWVDMRSHRR